ncbi:MAG: ABC transporter substrate-binding protein [Methanobacteriota archaeon]
MTIYLGIDDTDSLESIGTGRLARSIADEISDRFPVRGITRHQFLVHPDIPYTSHNSGAVITIGDIPDEDLPPLFERVISLMKARFVEGSDPGVALARDTMISAPVVIFGQDAKRQVLSQEMARKLASNTGILLVGLGGTEGGVIGALAGIGLASSGCDGRFLQLGTIRDIMGDQTVTEVLKTGIETVMTTDGRILTEGLIRIRKFPQPVSIHGRPILLVEELNDEWVLVKRD